MFQTNEPDIDRAKEALLAWYSIPDSKNATPRQEWQNKADFRELHEQFPELVDADGAGWFYNHVHHVARFVLEKPEKVRKDYAKYAEAVQSKFDKAWRDKVLQFQAPIFSLNTKGAWTLRFDDILAAALEQGPLMYYEVYIPEETQHCIEKLTDRKAVPYICDLIAYYHAHREEDCDWVVLPVTNFDMYHGGSYFSKRILPAIPKEALERQNHMGVCRYRISERFLLRITSCWSYPPCSNESTRK